MADTKKTAYNFVKLNWFEPFRTSDKSKCMTNEIQTTQVFFKLVGPEYFKYLSLSKSV